MNSPPACNSLPPPVALPAAQRPAPPARERTSERPENRWYASKQSADDPAGNLDPHAQPPKNCAEAVQLQTTAPQPKRLRKPAAFGTATCQNSPPRFARVSA